MFAARAGLLITAELAGGGVDSEQSIRSLVKKGSRGPGAREIRTLGPPSERCMQTPRSSRIASSGGADWRENGENADLRRCVISAADQANARSQARLLQQRMTGKAFRPRRPPTLRVGRSEVVKNSSRQQFLGLWSFFGRIHLCSSENTGAPRMADGLRTKERRLK